MCGMSCCKIKKNILLGYLSEEASTECSNTWFVSVSSRCGVPIGNRESPVCIFISDIKTGTPRFFSCSNTVSAASQCLQFSHLFQCKTCNEIPAAVSHLPPSTALYLPFFYHASCHHSSAVFSLYLLYKSTSYISIEKSTSGSLCVPDVLL